MNNGNRDRWTFQYPADKLLEATRAKIAFHKGRHEFWTKKRKETEKTIRAEGIEIDESLTDMSSNKSNYARGGSVQIRNDLVRDLQECVERQRHHWLVIEDYTGWEQVLASQSGHRFDLHHDDWLYFFGK